MKDEPRRIRRSAPGVTPLRGIPELRPAYIEPAPAPPVLGTMAPEISVEHMAMVDHWFASGCLSKRKTMTHFGLTVEPHRVFSRPEVAAYVRECLALRQSYMAKSEADIIAEYEKIAFSNLGDLLDVNDDGSAILDLSSLTPDMRAAISEYQVEQYTETCIEDGEMVAKPVKKFRIKFHDKRAALDALARIHGMNKDKVEVNGATDLISQINAARASLQPKEPTDAD